ncbi:MAG TPA: hypothetical protein ENO20_11765 [Bacteroides sp.]|nr:hypothetical protein [Bacteroides sp.]
MKKNNHLNRIITFSAIITIIGIIFSGPLGVLITSLVRPQPTWENVDVFIENYHPLQGLPFIFGFIMIIGFVGFISASAHFAETALEKTYGNMSLIFAAVYAGIIGTNYMIQMACVPNLFHVNKEMTGILTMANPASVTWLLEMFGYAFLGISLWLMVPVIKGGKRMIYIKYLLIINGVASILGAIITAINIPWVLSVSGIISYIAWNALIIAVMILVYLEYRGDRI